MLTVDIDRQYETNDTPSNKQLRLWAQCAYQGAGAAEVALTIVDSVVIRALNNRYRHKSSATNVLSFPANMGAIDGIQHLGDIVLCGDVIELQAVEQKKITAAHWAHMTVHGMLHLQHYDHADNVEAEAMEAMEIDLLATLNFSDPYYADSSRKEK